MKIGFVGLGNMGLPMSMNLLKSGFEVYGKNRSKLPEEKLKEAGGVKGLTLAELAREMDVIITCLPMPSDVEDVYTGPEGLIANGREGLILVDCSTVTPEMNRLLYEKAGERNIQFLDAPVSGGSTGAIAGTLSIMVGGKKEVFETVKPVLEAMGKNIYYVGESGSGSVVKLINQLMAGIHTQAVSEALALGRQAGLNEEFLVRILSNSFAQSRLLERHYSNHIAKSDYKPGFAIKLLSKDLNLVTEMAAKRGVRLTAGNRVRQLLQKAVKAELGDQDMSAMLKYQLRQDELLQKQGEAKYYAVFLPMKDVEKSLKFRPEHLQFLAEKRQAGIVFANGRFADGAGGLVIYRAYSYEEVEALVRQDPYIIEGARDYKIHEWDIVLAE